MGNFTYFCLCWQHDIFLLCLWYFSRIFMQSKCCTQKNSASSILILQHLCTRSTKEMWMTRFACLHAFDTYRTCAEVFDTGMGGCGGFYRAPLYVTELGRNWENWCNENEWYLNEYHGWKHDCGIRFVKQYDWMANAEETHGE